MNERPNGRVTENRRRRAKVNEWAKKMWKMSESENERMAAKESASVNVKQMASVTGRMTLMAKEGKQTRSNWSGRCWGR